MAKGRGGKKNNNKNKHPGNSYQRVAVTTFKGRGPRPAETPARAQAAGPEIFRSKLEIDLLEDLHSGTGQTAGDLDGVQLKDRDGVAMISRGHLKGLLREIAEELVALGLAAPEDVAAVFGAPHAEGRGRLAITSLYQDSRQASLVEWTSTARKEDQRGPGLETLRTVEHVGAGNRFHALLELVTAPGMISHKRLVEHCCKRLVALGSGRRVGDGGVTTKLAALMSAPPPFVIPYAAKHRPRPPAPSHTRLRLLIRTHDAACFPITGNPGNLIFSAGYMAGPAHRGAWIGALSELGQDAGWMLENGGPAFLDALPLPPGVLTEVTGLGALEAIPIPLDHPTRKPPAQEQDGWPWWGEPGPVVPSDDTKNKRPGEKEFLFRAAPTATWTRYAAELRVHLRNNAGDRWRRNLADQSLFSVEEIVERTDFLTEITFPDGAAAEKFANVSKDILEGRKWIKLGRGGAPAMVAGHVWMGPAVAPTLPADHDSLTLVLTSDLILRGPRLGYLLRPAGPDILGLAGIDPQVQAGFGPIEFKSMIDTTIIHGFNAASGVPRQLALAIRRGSSFTVKAAPEVIALVWQGLAGKLAEGLGDRRQEGYGRFRLEPDPILQSHLQVAELTAVTELEWRERAIAEGLELAQRLLKSDTFPQPSKGQLEELRRSIQTSDTIQKIERQIEMHARHAATVGGAAWQAFDFKAMDRNRSSFANNHDRWQRVLDTALRQLVRDAARHRLERDATETGGGDRS